MVAKVPSTSYRWPPAELPIVSPCPPPGRFGGGRGDRRGRRHRLRIPSSRREALRRGYHRQRSCGGSKAATTLLRENKLGQAIGNALTGDARSMIWSRPFPLNHQRPTTAPTCTRRAISGRTIRKAAPLGQHSRLCGDPPPRRWLPLGPDLPGALLGFRRVCPDRRQWP
jgi:hypothetical protein